MFRVHFWVLACIAGFGACLTTAQAGDAPSAVSSHAAQAAVASAPMPAYRGPVAPPFAASAPWGPGPWPGPGAPFGPWPGYGPVPGRAFAYPGPVQAWHPTGAPSARPTPASAPAARHTTRSGHAETTAAKKPSPSAGAGPSTVAASVPGRAEEPKPHFRPWSQRGPVAGASTTPEPRTKHETHFRPGLKAPPAVPHPVVKRTPDGFLINGSPPVFRPLPTGNASQKGEKKTNDAQPASTPAKAAPVGV